MRALRIGSDIKLANSWIGPLFEAILFGLTKGEFMSTTSSRLAINAAVVRIKDRRSVLVLKRRKRFLSPFYLILVENWDILTDVYLFRSWKLFSRQIFCTNLIFMIRCRHAGRNYSIIGCLSLDSLIKLITTSYLIYLVIKWCYRAPIIIKILIIYNYNKILIATLIYVTHIGIW